MVIIAIKNNSNKQMTGCINKMNKIWEQRKATIITFSNTLETITSKKISIVIMIITVLIIVANNRLRINNI